MLVQTVQTSARFTDVYVLLQRSVPELAVVCGDAAIKEQGAHVDVGLYAHLNRRLVCTPENRRTVGQATTESAGFRRIRWMMALERRRHRTPKHMFRSLSFCPSIMRSKKRLAWVSASPRLCLGRIIAHRACHAQGGAIPQGARSVSSATMTTSSSGRLGIRSVGQRGGE